MARESIFNFSNNALQDILFFQTYHYSNTFILDVILQYFSHAGCLGNVARRSFNELHVQWQFQSGMSSSSTW
jgi:hypothetical protein